MKLYIKNMVCSRCKMVVKDVLEHNGLHIVDVELGMVQLREEQLSKEQLSTISDQLIALGFELLDDKRSKTIEKIKNVVIDMVHHNDEPSVLKQSEVISQELNHDYSYLSKLFSEVEGITIEQYAIQQKIEKVKELLVYDELSLTGIAEKLGYSSVAHLSAQFKKITGLTPSQFKSIAPHHRKPLDQVGK